MEKLIFSLILFYSIINPIFPTHFESTERYLHVYEDNRELNKPLVIKNTEANFAEVINQRTRRDTSDRNNENTNKNITTKVSRINNKKKIVFPKAFDLLSAHLKKKTR